MTSAGEVTARTRQVPWTAAWVSVLLIFCYAPVLIRLVRQWSSDDDMGHGFLVPLLAGYIVWQRRGEWRALTPRPNWWGLVLILLAFAQLYVAILGSELFFSRTALVISVAGAVLLLGGSRHLRVLAFPIAVLLFMIPIPGILYNKITFPLQLLASRVAEASLTVLQIPVLREGNILQLPSLQLSVVEACSGIRSLLSLAFLSLVYGYLFERKMWLRVLLFVATAPIAIVANAGRVTLTGVLAEFKPELAEGMFHEASGWMVFMIAMLLLAGLHRSVQRGWELVARRRAS